MFAAAAAASAGASTWLAVGNQVGAPARRMAVGGAIVEVALVEGTQRRLRELVEPLRARGRRGSRQGSQWPN